MTIYLNVQRSYSKDKLIYQYSVYQMTHNGLGFLVHNCKLFRIEQPLLSSFSRVLNALYEFEMESRTLVKLFHQHFQQQWPYNAMMIGKSVLF